jgi:signal transduction histidine kinase
MSNLTKSLFALLLLSLCTAQARAKEDVSKLSIPELKRRIESIDSELGTLAHFSVRSGIGSIGYRSMWHKTADHPEWVQIQLGQEFPLTEIVLVPNLWRDSGQVFQSDAFPETFRLIAGNKETPKGRLVAEFKMNSQDLPRIAPLVIPVAGLKASWIRIEVPHLPLRASDNLYAFQLAEILIFSGEENVALRRSASASSMEPKNVVRTWDQRFLTDGHMPYLMQAASGEKSIAYVSQWGEKQVLQLDLKEAAPISRIHLHALDQSGTAPLAHGGVLGLPQKLLIEGASLPDFSDARILLESQKKPIIDTGPIMMWMIPETVCRYVRIHDADPAAKSLIGFAEIELFSNGRNVAYGKTVTATPPADPTRNLRALTDGCNQSGKILSTRNWLEQLARRHVLETERPLLITELNRRYARQQAQLRQMIWLTALLAAGIGFTLLISRMLRMRNETRLRERFAADLHDELGANIHTIGLLGDLARDAESHDELIELLDQSRFFTERSGAAVRNCTNMLEAHNLCDDLIEEMTRSSERLLADLEHDLSFTGKELLANLKPRQRIDLFFFYKECLNNIIRHSGATHVCTQLIADHKKIGLTITDNGVGLQGTIPASLKRRARIMGAHITAEKPTDGGTKINLQIRTRHGLQRKLKPQT